MGYNYIQETTMNTRTLITVKVEPVLKQAARATAEELGLPLGTLIKAYLKQLVHTREVTLSASLRPSRSLIASITAAEKEMIQGVLPKPVKTVKALAQRLRA